MFFINSNFDNINVGIKKIDSQTFSIAKGGRNIITYELEARSVYLLVAYGTNTAWRNQWFITTDNGGNGAINELFSTYTLKATMSGKSVTISNGDGSYSADNIITNLYKLV